MSEEKKDVVVVVVKQLKDYPLKEWMEAADGCDYCKAKAQIMVTWIDESGDFGDVHIQYKHEDDCSIEFGDQFSDNIDVAGWEFSSKILKIAGEEIPTLKSRMNIAPCLSCWKLVVGVPLILWLEDGSVEMDFCFPCAEKLGILDQLKERATHRG